jgi:nucleoside-diphosphate-sugar epimerase
LRAGDATDAEFLTNICTGAAALFNCANPPYHRWLTDWPPLADALLQAAQKSGATLVTLSNLYAYGKPTGPMTPLDPLRSTLPKAMVRAKMWNDALALHEAGKIQAVEVRASDFIGDSPQSQFAYFLPRLFKGKALQVLGDPDALHTWSYVDDVARTLVAVAQNAEAWGKVWHVPSNAPRSSRQVFNELADRAGISRTKISGIPSFVLRALGLVNPQMRELVKTQYQFKAPFVMEDKESREVLGIEPTPWDLVLDGTLKPFLPVSKTPEKSE